MAEAELALINKVELRIALAENDKQFESALNIYLPPLLLKLSSPHADVRKAVLKIIQYLIPRISAARSIRLPIESLLDQVKHPKVPSGANPSSVRLYSLLFISRSIDRLNDEEKVSLVPKVIEGLGSYTEDIACRLFNILTKLLSSWKAPDRHSPEHENMASFLHFDERPEDEKYLSSKISKFLLVRANPGPHPIQTPGLSVADNAFFTQNAGVSYKTQQEVFAVKKSLVEFLKSGFDNKNLAIPLMIASVDESSAINDSSDILFRKLNIDIEDPELVTNLIQIFTGSPSEGIPPAKSTLQERILAVLINSKEASKSSEVSTICNIGLSSDYLKLKQTTVQFIKQISKNSTEQGSQAARTIKDFNINMAARLKENLQSEGWPQIDTSAVKNYSAATSQRVLQYEALGNILRSNPELFLDDLQYVEFLFQSLDGENTELRATIQEALSSLTVHLPQLSLDSKTKLKSLAKSYLSYDRQDGMTNLHSCRFVAIKYVNCAFPFEDPEARFLCALGTSKENRADTIEEAVKGLHPHWFNILQATNTLEFKSTSELLGSDSTVRFPSFSSLVKLLNEELEANKFREDATIFKSLGSIIEFINQTLVMHAVRNSATVVVADEEWSVRLEKAIEVDKVVQDLVIKDLSQLSQEGFEGAEVIKTFLISVFDSFVAQYTDSGKVASDIRFGQTFTKLITWCPQDIVGQLPQILHRLVELLNGKFLNDVAIGQICKCIGIIGSHPANDDHQVSNLLLQVSAEKSPKFLIRGRLLATAFLISRLVYRGRTDVVQSSSFRGYVSFLIASIQDTTLHGTILECISQLSIYGAFNSDIALYDTISNDLDAFTEFIKPKVKKCDEKAVLTYSYLSLCKSEKAALGDQTLNEFEQTIYDSHVSKQIEYIFTSGEALSICVGGWESKVLQRAIDIQGVQRVSKSTDISRVSKVLEVILSACTNTKPSLRKAGCIWLLSFTQFLSHLQPIRDRAKEIHITFMRFLADRDELVQEAASRGLSLVYEMGDVELKDTLVKGLLKSFTDTNASSALAAGSVEEDTELFDKDILKTNDGSVSTYKDVLNLASDVGDPSLVYKFMSLAKSSALWSSRKGMAFGLGSILSKSSLDDMLSKNKHLNDRLIPKLYRYKYDPSSSVAQSMNDIWNALIKDSSKTVNENFDSILGELLKSMGNKEWRVRQASTTALNDLLQTVQLDKYEQKLEQIWNMSFRVMDDIKESVRKEGAKLTRALSTTLSRMADVENGKVTISKAKDVLSTLIPFLLGNKGLLSDAEDIRHFALQTILKLCKIGGAAVKPFVPNLLDNFISLMSTLEPEVVNYLVLNADKYNLNNNDIDAQRLQSVGRSPMMDAIEKLLDLVDESLMDEIVRVLRSTIKKSVGLPSKICGSRVLVTLISKNYAISKPYGDKLFTLCVSQITDRNDTVASSYLTAAGHICRIASIDAIINYSDTVNSLYFKSEDERSRKLAALASESVSKHSGGDRFELVASAFLPLAYIGKHDPVKEVASIFEREWIENTSGNSAVKLYLAEISAFAETYLGSNQYQIRQVIAKSIADLCNVVDDIKSLELTTLLFKILLEACKGKSWAGKELVLEALVTFSIKSSQFLNKDQDTLDSINKVVVTEAKRRNREYQKHSVKLLGNFLHYFYDEDVMDAYLELMDNKILADDYYADEDDDDAMEDIRDSRNKQQKSSAYNIKIEDERSSFIKNLFTTMSKEHFNQGLFELSLTSIANLYRTDVIDNTWRSKVESNECIRIMLEDNGKVPYSDNEVKVLMSTWKEIYKNCLNVNNIERVKIETIRNAKRLIDALEDTNAVNDANLITSQLKIFKNVETSTTVQHEIEKALENS